jgi:superfamily II DNA helicase RecQ
MSQSLDILRSRFGYSAFRFQQQQIIDTLVAGDDALVLMPTGGGKSLCYQIPAIVREGVGVVISPLIALMQDQVDALAQNGIKAAFLNSTQSPQQQFRPANRLLQAISIYSTSHPNVHSPSTSWICWASVASPCSPSTRRIAYRNGATTSGPITRT